MKHLLQKTILTLAILLMITASAWAQSITITNGNTNSTNYTLTSSQTTLTITVPSGTAYYSGIIICTSGSPCFVVKQGAGKLVITNTNTASLCGINVMEGTFQIGNGNGSVGAFPNCIGAAVSSGAVLRFEPGSNMTINYVISGAGSVQYAGSSTRILEFPANNTYTGTTTIESGDLCITGTAGNIAGNIIVQSGASLYFSRTNAYTYSGVISGAGEVCKYRSGTTTLNGVNTYTGATYITMGTLALGSSGTIATSSSVYVQDNTAKFDITAGNKTIKNLNGSYANAEVVLGTRTLSIGIAGEANGGGTYAGKFTGNAAATSNAIDKLGTAVLSLSGTSNYTGRTRIRQGTITFSSLSNFGSSTIYFFYSGSVPTVLRWANGNSADVSARVDYPAGERPVFDVGSGNTVTFATALPANSSTVTKEGPGKLILTANNTYTGATVVTTGTLQISGNNGDIGTTSGVTVAQNGTLRFEPGNSAKTFSKVISGAGKVEIKGSSALRLTGDNTYTGGTTIETGGNLSIGNGAAAGSVAGNIAVQTGATLTFYRSTGETIFPGVISGAGNVVCQGTPIGLCRVILTGTNTYTGQTTVGSANGNASLRVGNGTSGSIQNTSNVVVNSGSTLRFEPGASMTFSKVISGDGNVQYAGSNTKALLLTANNTYTGTTTIETGGYLYIGSNSTTGAIAGNIVNNGALYFSRSNAYTYSGIISGTGTVYQWRNSTLTLNGANTYTGRTYIDEGTLALGASGSIAQSSEVFISTLDNTTKFNISAGNKTIKALNSSNPFAEVVLGARTLTLGTAGTDDGGGVFRGIFSGTGGVTKAGTASFEMVANHTATGSFALTGGTLNFTGKWTGNFTKSAGATLTVNGNPTIGGNLTLQGGVTNMSLTSSSLAKLTVTGSVSASGTNTLNITSNPVSDYVLIQAGSGISSTTPYTVNLSGLHTHLSATGSQLLLTASTTPLIPTITSTMLPDGLIGTSYSENLTATGLTPIAWSFEGGMLPPGLTFAATGAITGTPTAEGTFNFTVKATNEVGNAVGSLSIKVNANTTPPQIVTNTLPAGVAGTAYSEQLAATGTAPITWSLESGTLPAGLTISTAGIISGTPIASGTSNFTVKATNSVGNDTKALAITVTAPPVITTTTLPGCVIGTAYNQTLTATGTAPITWSLESGNLPNDVTLSAEGVISGTPTTAGDFNFTVKATNSAGSDTKVLSITVTTSAVAPAITTATLPDGKTGTAYSAPLEATGTAPFTWSLASGNLPNGLTLSSAGGISGTPTAVGTFNFTVQASNSAGNDTKALSIKIEGGIGVPENETTSIKVYPNPTTGQLTIDNGQLTIENVEVFDVYGRKHESTKARKHEGEVLIDISHLSAGIYFVKIRTEAGIVTQKIIKN